MLLYKVGRGGDPDGIGGRYSTPADGLPTTIQVSAPLRHLTLLVGPGGSGPGLGSCKAGSGGGGGGAYGEPAGRLGESGAAPTSRDWLNELYVGYFTCFDVRNLLGRLITRFGSYFVCNSVRVHNPTQLLMDLV